MAGRVGAGEVAHDQRRRHGGEQGGIAGELQRFVQGQAEAIHARIDVDRRSGRCTAATMRRPFFDLGRGVEHRPEVMGDERIGAPLDEPGQHVDRRPARHAPDADAFLGERDEERPATRRRERPHHRLDAEPVGVGLHRRRRLGARRMPVEQRPVGRQRVEVDGQPRAGDRGGAPVGRIRRHGRRLHGSGRTEIWPSGRTAMSEGSSHAKRWWSGLCLPGPQPFTAAAYESRSRGQPSLPAICALYFSQPSPWRGKSR